MKKFVLGMGGLVGAMGFFSLGIFYEREVRLPEQEFREVWYVESAVVSQDYRRAVMTHLQRLEISQRHDLEHEALKKLLEAQEFRLASGW